MAIRKDKYGHIIRDDEPTPNSNTNTGNNFSGRTTDSGIQADTSSSSLLQTSTPWYGSSGFFWTSTLVFAFIIAYIASTMIVPVVFVDEASDYENIFHYAVFIGAFVGSTWYNIKGTRRSENYYVTSEYIISPLCAVAGAVGICILIFLFALAIYIIVYVLIIGAFIGAIFGG